MLWSSSAKQNLIKSGSLSVTYTFPRSGCTDWYEIWCERMRVILFYIEFKGGLHIFKRWVDNFSPNLMVCSTKWKVSISTISWHIYESSTTSDKVIVAQNCLFCVNLLQPRTLNINIPLKSVFWAASLQATYKWNSFTLKCSYTRNAQNLSYLKRWAFGFQLVCVLSLFTYLILTSME